MELSFFFIPLRPINFVIMNNSAHMSFLFLYLVSREETFTLTSFSFDGLQMCGVCLNTQLLPYYNVSVCTDVCSSYARAVAAEERCFSFAQPLFSYVHA